MLLLYMESSFFGSYMDITEYLLLTLLPSDMMYPSSSNFFFVVVHVTFLPYLSFACSIAHNLSLSLLKRAFSLYYSGTSKNSLSNKYNKSNSLKKSHRVRTASLAPAALTCRHFHVPQHFHALFFAGNLNSRRMFLSVPRFLLCAPACSLI